MADDPWAEATPGAPKPFELPAWVDDLPGDWSVEISLEFPGRLEYIGKMIDKLGKDFEAYRQQMALELLGG
jgi:hypothetical protein